MAPVECNRLRLGMSFYRLIAYSMRRSITVVGTQAHLPRRDCDEHLNQRQRAWHPAHAPFATTATVHRSIGGFPQPRRHGPGKGWLPIMRPRRATPCPPMSRMGRNARRTPLARPSARTLRNSRSLREAADILGETAGNPSFNSQSEDPHRAPPVGHRLHGGSSDEPRLLRAAGERGGGHPRCPKPAAIRGTRLGTCLSPQTMAMSGRPGRLARSPLSRRVHPRHQATEQEDDEHDGDDSGRRG
jgi:hypothetical protein